jgi:hypothetical protein
LVTDEIPNLDRATFVVGGSVGVAIQVGHLLTRFFMELVTQKHCLCNARNNVMMSSFRVDSCLKAFSIFASSNVCSIVSSTIGAGRPESWLGSGEIIVFDL